MTSFVQAFNNTARTWNGDLAFQSSLDANVDLFYQAGASRGKDIQSFFDKALVANEEVAVRTLLWLRDAREGAGERQQFKNLVLKLRPEVVEKIIPMIPELGRWDDLLVFLDTPYQRQAVGVIAAGLNMNNGLCAKWMPRQGIKAAKIRKELGIKSPRLWRQLLVSLSNTVEQKMCAKEWNTIEFGKIPSVAAGRYIKAFFRNAPEAYAAYKAKLEKGEEKINAGAVYPYNVIQAGRWGDWAVAEAQWKALPNYMEGCEERILPMVDTSGSMASARAGGYGSKSEVTCMDVAISLGIYIAQRNVGVFKDVFMSFHSAPQLLQFSGNLSDAYRQVIGSPWGMSTNIEAAFVKILQAAQFHKLPQDQMPTKILILSDMQFNQCVQGYGAYDSMKRQYAAAGYDMPQIVFWNINSEAGTSPVTADTKGTALVSGFSPSILKGLLKGELDPKSVMLSTVMVDRYNYLV